MSERNKDVSRDKLVRANFDAYSELVWTETLEPKFREYDLDADSMRRYRDAWNAHTEKRDWAWWQENVKDASNEELQAEIAKCDQKINAIRARERRSNQRDAAQQTFQDILSRNDNGDQGAPEPTLPLTKGRKL